MRRSSWAPSRGAPENCSKKSVRREGGSVIIESVCQVEGSTATTRGVFTGDLATSYNGDMTTRFDPPMNGMAESKMSPDQARRMAEEMQRKYGKQ